MKVPPLDCPADCPWPRWWRGTLIALCTLILCSCRAAPPADRCPAGSGKFAARTGAADQMTTLPPQAWTGGPTDGYTMPSGGPQIAPTAALGIPLPETLVTPWAPPGIAQPWPHDEYLHDGGDGGAQVTVGPDDQLRGLELEDTIVHYDTIDGRTIVEPSNRVDLYSPRFAAVRRIESVHADQQSDRLVQVELPIKPNRHEEQLVATTAVQPLQARHDVGIRQSSISRLNQAGRSVSNRLQLVRVEGGFAPHEDFEIIRRGVFEYSEKAWLAERIAAAIAWSHDKAVQVILERQQAVVETGDARAQATFRVDVPNHPRLRVVKVASTNIAKPGDIVDFTIRFDNIGDQVIGNVTLVDNLTTRLEYVPDSAQSSRKAEFFSEPNEGDSLLLRWEFVDPLSPGDGGLVRFHCRVR